MPSVMFVCLGNICRSPAAEGILRHMIASDPGFQGMNIKSCGMGDWHIGQLPDTRMRETAKQRGIILTSRAQRFAPVFLDEFDFILAADHEVLKDLHRYARTPEHKNKIHLITVFSSAYKDEEIPDPYYQGEAAFEHILDMLEDSCKGLLDHLRE